MNFYTSNFKRGYIYIAIVSFIIFVVGFDILIYALVSSKTDKDRYIEEKFSRAKHMSLNIKNQKDFIFIGSSRVKYQISSKIFRDRGIDIFNFGVSGRELIDFPYMLTKAIEQKSKNIVISMSIDRLYKGARIGDYTQIAYQDLKALISTKQDKKIIQKAFFAFIKRVHLLSSYGVTINKKIQILYNSMQIESDKKTDLSIKAQKERKPDCNILKRYKTTTGVVVNCTNGEGVMYGKDFNISTRDIRLKEIDKNYIRLINYLIEKSRLNGIDIIIIFDPVYESNYSYDIDKLKQNIDTNRILDLTNYRFSHKYWGDKGHLNIYGRELYSNYLAKELKVFLDE